MKTNKNKEFMIIVFINVFFPFLVMILKSIFPFLLVNTTHLVFISVLLLLVNLWRAKVALFLKRYYIAIALLNVFSFVLISEPWAILGIPRLSHIMYMAFFPA